MTTQKLIVCLAISRKTGGRCIAGKEVTPNGIGGWVRPVSSAENGALKQQQIAFKNGKTPELLDLLLVPITTRAAHPYQSENYMIDEHRRWELNGRSEKKDLPKLYDPVETLWINGHHSSQDSNDKVPVQLAARELHSSLLLICPTRVQLIVSEELIAADQRIIRRLRADFYLKGIHHRLVVTDPEAEYKYFKLRDGVYPIDKEVYLCVSLSEPYRGFAYKLVAAIIGEGQD
jgi:hypothetical protein